MSKFARGGSAWKEHRLADRLTVGGEDYTVQLVARRGTGVQGYRVTVHYIPHNQAGARQIDLPNLSSTADIHRLVRELEADVPRLGEMFEQAGVA